MRILANPISGKVANAIFSNMAIGVTTMFKSGQIVKVKGMGFAVIVSVSAIGLWVRYEEDRTNTEYLISIDKIHA